MTDTIVKPTTDAETPEEVVVVGLNNSLKLMIIALASFFCMCIVFTSLVLWKFDTMITALSAGALGFTLFVTIYMTIRYHTEQLIVYNAMNIQLAFKQQTKEE